MRGDARRRSHALAVGLSLGALGALGACAGAGDPSSGGAPEVAQAQPHSQDEHSQDEHSQDEHSQDEHSQDEHSQAAAEELPSEGLLRALRARWAELSVGRHAGLPSRAQIDGLIAAPPAPPRLDRRACAELHRSFVERAGPDLGQGSQGPSDGAYVILDGSGEALRNSGGECRLLLVDGVMGPSLEAAFGADGRLLFLWMIAEG